MNYYTDWLKAYGTLRREALADLARSRARVVESLLKEGWTYRSLAAELGVSPTRVHQWAHPKFSNTT